MKNLKRKNQNKTSNYLPPAAHHLPELMAPAGDWTMLRAAVRAGADAVYFGVDKLNMRAKARNFSIEELPEITKFCGSKKIKTYLALNAIVFEDEIDKAEQIIVAAKKAKMDRIICWDLAVAELCRKHDFPFCISTQGSVSNSLAASVYKKLGAKRIVLARECSLEEIKKIKDNTDLEIEVFIHGAMCIAISGRCFMSHHLFDKSANRGECIQPCRREYKVYDNSADKSLLVGEDYVLSPEDLCSIEFIDQLIEAGIDSFKIEGRKRSPEYVSKVVSVYRKAIDLYFEKNLTKEIKKDLLNELKKVYNRGFSSGFYFGQPSSDDYAYSEGSKATTRKVYVGKVINYFKNPNVVHTLIESGIVNEGADLLIVGETTGIVELKLESMMRNDKPSKVATKGDEITFKSEKLIRPRDKIYLLENVV
jgi:putative protease